MRITKGLAAAALFSALIAPASATAHSGGTDTCGGHHDHKRGGYHVHNYSMYCECYPRYAGCVNYPTKGQAEEGKDGSGKATDKEDGKKR